MDASLKQKALQNLASTAGGTAEAAVRKEMAKIVAILQSESQYSELTEQLELLDIIAYRVHNDALVAVRDFLERVADLELTHEEIEGYPAEQLREFQTKDTIVAFIWITFGYAVQYVLESTKFIFKFTFIRKAGINSLTI